MMRSLIKAFRANTFNYWKWLEGKITRLLPIVLIASAISLCIGFFTMLPDDLENLSETVIASNVFANNILSSITTKNYWDIANLFKPLMHTWYLGVLMQAYVVLPLIYLGVFNISKKNIKAVKTSVIVVALVSLAIFCAPIATTAEKFYYLPFRIFEINAGSIVAFMGKRKEISQKSYYLIEAICLSITILLMCINEEYLSPSIKLILVVLSTAILVYLYVNTQYESNVFAKAFSYVGRASLSIYIFHQIVVAFMFYAVTDSTSLITLVAFLSVVFVVSIASFYMIEKPINLLASSKPRHVLIASLIVCLLLSSLSGLVYLNAGVVRDVPELGIDKTSVHRGMHAEYCDIPFSWDTEFVSSNEKVKVCVVGNSFGRDWANVLNESSITDRIEISYIYQSDTYDAYVERLSKADIVFRVLSSPFENLEDDLYKRIPSDKLYFVGYKNFGSSNGIIYAHRGFSDYYDQTISLDNGKR